MSRLDDAISRAESAEGPALADLEDHALVEELEARGWVLHRDDPKADRHIEIDAPKRGTVRIAIASDTHLGSKYQQLTHWRTFAQAAQDFGADIGLHAGDAVDGTHKMHRGMEFEQFRLGFEAQGNYAVDHWPEYRTKRGKRPVEQYVIGGNHDGSFHNDTGANILAKVAAARDDITFLGAPAATFHISGLDIYMLHPDGGPSYARSYRLQKIVEQLAPDTKPHVMVCGHWHVAAHVPGYRNVEAFALPCFQAQTPYLRRKGLAPVLGGLLLELEFSERGLEDMTTKWVRFPSAIDKDW